MQNLHGIQVKSLPATNNKPIRIQVKSLRFPRNYITLPVNKYVGDTLYMQAANYLRSFFGHKITSMNEVVNADGTTHSYILHSDTFEKLV